MIEDLSLPNHPDIERAVLGACMLGGLPALEVVRAKLDNEAFYHSHHRLIFGALCRLASDGKPLDQTAVMLELEASKHLEAIDGPVTIAEIASDVATYANVGYHAGIVAEDWAKRQIIVEAQKVIAQAQDPITDAGELIASLEKKMQSIAPVDEDTWLDADIGLHEAFQAVEYARKHPGEIMGVRTGFDRLDSCLGGLQKGDLVLVAARPSMGKTSFGLHVARHAGVPVAFVSAEMGSRALSIRLLASDAKVDSRRMRDGTVTEEEYVRLQDVLAGADSGKIQLTSALRKPIEIISHVRQLQKESGCGLVVVDYLQLLLPDEREQNREREVASIGDALKQMALSLDIPVLAMVQLSRAPEQRQDKRPALSDLRDSGTLEQTADVVMFLYRGEYYEPEKAREEGKENLCEVIIGKHRNGPVGYVKTYFDLATGVWGGWADEAGDPQAFGGTQAFDGSQGAGTGADRGCGVGDGGIPDDVPDWVNR